ncbi:MAG: hypothetical protein Q8M08_02260 [Bacteroidales bacterium]|nr:hypothetical protein [Bacteroidales bacterium]
MDFTILTYRQLLNALLSRGCVFQTFSEYLKDPAEKAVILRHDVDARKEHALRFAKIQAEPGIRGSYYFRVAPQSWDEKIIREINDLGHEIGYHYETMESVSAKWKKGNVRWKRKMQDGKCKMQDAKYKMQEIVDVAYEEFCRNLEMFRRIVPVETICMHGSPLSKFDNREIWKKYDYRSLGIIGEPYFDLDFRRVAYLTDTGRMWDGERFSVRDKAPQKEYRISNIEYRMSNGGNSRPGYHSTFDIIRAVENGTFPLPVMMTFHPQRWHDSMLSWSRELIFQKAKNLVKRGFFVSRDR